MKSRVLTKSTQGFGKFLAAFLCCFAFSLFTTQSWAQDYPLNGTVEIVGVEGNLGSDNLGILDNPDPYFQIGGFNIFINGLENGSIANVPSFQIWNGTVDCGSFAGGTFPVALPTLTAHEEDDCVPGFSDDPTVCDPFELNPLDPDFCLNGDENCISNANPSNPIDLLSAAFGSGAPGIYDYALNYASAGIVDAYVIHVRVTIIPNTNEQACNAVVDCGADAQLLRYQCNNDQTDISNATADAYLEVTQVGQPTPSTFTVVESVGATFPYGNTVDFSALASPIDFVFRVVEDQPWYVKLVDQNGCTLVADGVFDLPNPEILGLAGQYCLADPPNLIYDNATFQAGTEENPFGVGVVGQFFGNGISNFAYIDADGNNEYTPGETFQYVPEPAGPPAGFVFNGSAKFDPFIAGTGQHLITYEILDYAAASGNVEYQSCEIQADFLVNVYPTIYPAFEVDETVCVDSAPITLNPEDANGNDAADIIAQFDALSSQFDPADEIIEADDYISFAGVGVSNDLNGEGTATFNPAAAGVGTHAIELTIGYPSCIQTYTLSVEVVETVDATINDWTICASTSEAFDLTALFGATTNNGGTFAIVGATPAGVVGVNGDVLVYDADDNANFPITVTIEYTVGDATAGPSGSCLDTDQATLTILDEMSDIDFDLPSTICAGDVIDLDGEGYISGSDFLGTGSFSFVSGNVAGDALDGVALTFTAANDVSDGRVVVIRYTQDNGTCVTVVESNITVVDASIPDPVLTLPTNVCEFDDCVNLYDFVTAGNTGGTFFINGVESLTGIMCPEDYSGAVTIRYDVVAPLNNACVESANGTINIVEGPDPEFEVASATTAIAAGTVGVTADDDLTELCSRDECYTVVTASTPELLPTWDGLSDVAVSNDSGTFPQTLTATVTIPSASLANNVYFHDLAFVYDYETIPGSTVSQGDHNGFMIQGPGGVDIIVPIPDNTNPDGVSGPGADNHFEPDTVFVVVDGELTGQALPGYSAAAAAAGFDLDGEPGISSFEAMQYFLGLFEECEDVNFVYELITNAAESQINLELIQDARAVDTQGKATASLHETGTDITLWAIQLNTNPYDESGNLYNPLYGYYSFCTRNSEYGGPEGIDLAAYDEIDITFTTGSCDATNDAGDVCNNMSTTTVIVLETVDASLADIDDVCADGDDIDLEQLYVEGVTTPSGSFSVDNGMLNGNYLDLSSVDLGGADSVDVTVSYTVGEGSTCDPATTTMMITVFAPVDASFDYPSTVCSDAVPALPAGVTASWGDPVTPGLYTLTNSLTNGACSDEVTQEVLVIASPVVAFDEPVVTICLGQTINLTPNLADGTTSGGTFTDAAGQNIGNVFVGSALGDNVITYCVGVPDTDCFACDNFTVTVVESNNATFDAPGALCIGETVNLTDYFVASTTMGGTFTVSDGTTTDGEYTAPEGLSSVVVTYTVGSGDCTDSHEELLLIVNPDTSVLPDNAVCQSTDDFSIDLSQYLLTGPTVNGGTFQVANTRPFINELEYSENNLEFVEIAGAAGTDLAGYMVVFYDASMMATDNIGESNGRVYGVWDLGVGTQGTGWAVNPAVSITDGNGMVYNQNNGLTPAAWCQPPSNNQFFGLTYSGSNPATPRVIDAEQMGNNGISYGAVSISAVSGNFDIKDGPAGIALVRKGDPEDYSTPQDDEYFGVCENTYEVVQFIGYGVGQTIWQVDGETVFTGGSDPQNPIANGDASNGYFDFLDDCDHHVYAGDEDADPDFDPNPDNFHTNMDVGMGLNTNQGIFAACDGPAAGLVTTDINAVDVSYAPNQGGNRSLQFTNTCWEVPNITDQALNYPRPNTQGCTAVNWNQNSPEYYTPGQLNWGQLEAGMVSPTTAGSGCSNSSAEEFYFDYIAPNGDILDLSNFCESLFVGGLIVEEDETYTYGSGGNDGDVADDGGILFDFQKTQVYPITFDYSVPAGSSEGLCANNEVTVYIMSHYDEWWEAPAFLCEEDCEYNLSTLLMDSLQFIPPEFFEGELTLNASVTCDENIVGPAITEIHYDWYEEFGEFADDSRDQHCVTYNYIDNNNTPFNYEDDSYETTFFCDGIEVSALAGQDLSCYELVFYREGVFGLESGVEDIEQAGGLMYDVTYIGPDGFPISTDVANGEFMRLYGTVDDDTPDEYDPNSYFLGYNAATGTTIALDELLLDFYDNNGEFNGEGNPGYEIISVGDIGYNVDFEPNAPAGEFNDNGNITNFNGPCGDPFASPLLNEVDLNWNNCATAQGAGMLDPDGMPLLPGLYIDLAGAALEDYVIDGEITALGNGNGMADADSDYLIFVDVNQNGMWDAGEERPFGSVDCANNDVIDAHFEEYPAVVNGQPLDDTHYYPAEALHAWWDEVFPWERANSCGAGFDRVGSRWYPIADLWDGVLASGDRVGVAVGLYNRCSDKTYELIVYNGEDICVQNSPDFTLAGPYEHQYAVGDTVQNVNNNLGDERTMQLFSCSMVENFAFTTPDGAAASIQNCSVCQDEMGAYDPTETFWAIVYDGGAFSVFGCGGMYTMTPIETSDFSNTIGYYNCNLDPAYFDRAPCYVEIVVEDDDLPDNYVITEHDLILTGSGGFAYNWIVGDGGSNGYNDTDDGNIIPNGGSPFFEGYSSDANFVDDDGCTYSRSMPGCGPGGCGYDGEGRTDCYIGLQQLNLNIANGFDMCDNSFEGQCTKRGERTYYANVWAAVTTPNTTGGDTCVMSMVTPGTFTLNMQLNIKYQQCIPVGSFFGQGVAINTDDVNDPYWEFDPSGLCNISPVEITYDVYYEHELDADEPGDNVLCMDESDEDRTQLVPVVCSGATASLSTDALDACTADGPINLMAYVSGTASGMWTVSPASAGLAGSTFNPSMAAAGTYTLTYSVAGGENLCGGTFDGDITLTLGESGSVNTAGIPASVCSLDAISLPAATWSGNGVSGNTFTPAAAGTYTLDYTAGSGACGTSGSVTIDVSAPIVVGEASFSNIVAGSSYDVTINISGGNGSYTVNGAAIAGSSYTTTIACPNGYTMVVGSAGCPTVTVAGNAPDGACDTPCAPEAGTLSVNFPGSGQAFCTTTGVTMATAGDNDDANTVFALTDPTTGDVILLSENGIFNAPPGGSYNAWVVNTCNDLGTVPTNAGAIGAEAAAGNLDVDGPIAIDVAPELTLDLVAICDDAFGGYVIQVTVNGGAPALASNGCFGSYSLNFPLYSGTLTGSPCDDGLTAIIANQGPSGLEPFPQGAIIAVSVDSDGSLCEVSETVSIPTEACGINAEANQEFTLADEAITFNVLDNDQGNGLTVTNVTTSTIDPSQGTLDWTADGQFTFTPAPGYTGEVTFTYQVVNEFGATDDATVTILVTGETTQAEDLAVSVSEDCSGAETTGFYSLIVTIQGGVAPYTITGTYNDVLNVEGSITITGIADGSTYTVQVSDAAGAISPVFEDNVACSKVAVELLSFSGSVEMDGDLLKWVTASEFNNDYFTLEHSTDGVNYAVIATVAGAGTTNTTTSYSELYKDAAAGANYYRLSATDFDGSVVTYDPITLVRGELGLGFVNLYPVPASNVLNVTFTSVKSENVRLEIYNVAGKLIATDNVDATQGVNATQINVSNYAVGTYFMSINDGENVTTTRFVVE